jgi:hypothetical protein
MAADLPLILLDGVTSATTGPALGLAYQMALGGNRTGVSTLAKQYRDVPIEVYLRMIGTSGDSATVVFETATDAAFSSPVTWLTVTLTLTGTQTGKHQNSVGALKTKYIRARVSSYTGTPTLNSYVKFK